MKRSEYVFRSAHARAVSEVGPPRLTETRDDYTARVIERMEKTQAARLRGLVQTLALSGQIEGSR